MPTPGMSSLNADSFPRNEKEEEQGNKQSLKQCCNSSGCKCLRSSGSDELKSINDKRHRRVCLLFSAFLIFDATLHFARPSARNGNQQFCRLTSVTGICACGTQRPSFSRGSFNKLHKLPRIHLKREGGLFKVSLLSLSSSSSSKSSSSSSSIWCARVFQIARNKPDLRCH